VVVVVVVLIVVVVNCVVAPSILGVFAFFKK